MGKRILEMTDICKSFPGVKALDQAGLVLDEGEVLGVLGENGAGKSTLIKVLSGAYSSDSGTITIDGVTRGEYKPFEAIGFGISVIYQELNYIDSLSVAENIFLGNLPLKKGHVDYNALKAASYNVQKEVGLEDIFPLDSAASLSVAQKQLMEVAKAFAKDAKIIVMDEPTAALTENEIKQLFRIINKFREKGGAIIYITHKLDEIFEITDSVMVMRDGKNISRWKTGDVNKQQLVSAMIGRELKDMYPIQPREIKETVFEVEGLSTDFLDNISFSVKSGEIVALYGLIGSGCEEITAAIYGLAKKKAGSIKMFGQELETASPYENLQNGIAYVPSERKALGLVMDHSVKDNISLAILKKLTKKGILDFKKEIANAGEWMKALRIVPNDMYLQAGQLSGGNQQKVVIAKSMNTTPKLLIMNEPTRGVDVGAKVEIYGLMEQYCKQGVGIIMVSSEMPETMAIADRVIAIYEGRITAEFTKGEISQEKLGNAAIGNMKGA